MYRRKIRKGVAAVEAAVCLPVLALIFFGALEVSGGIYQEYNAQASTFELSKVALSKFTTCDDIQDFAESLLPQQGFNTYSIAIVVEPRTVNSDSVESPLVTNFVIPISGSTTDGLDELPRGTLLRLTLTADRPSVGRLGFARNFLSAQITSDCVFVKEF